MKATIGRMDAKWNEMDASGVRINLRLRATIKFDDRNTRARLNAQSNNWSFLFLNSSIVTNPSNATRFKTTPSIICIELVEETVLASRL